MGFKNNYILSLFSVYYIFTEIFSYFPQVSVLPPLILLQGLIIWDKSLSSTALLERAEIEEAESPAFSGLGTRADVCGR